MVTVPEREGSVWTPALDYVTAGRLYRILVEAVPEAAPGQAAPGAAPQGVAAASAAPAVVPQAGVATPGVQQLPAAPPQPAGPAPSGPAPAAVPAPPPPPPPQARAPQAAPALRDQRWNPEAGVECTADGDASLTRNGAMIVDTCLPGALIAKIGGSSAEVRPDKDRLVFSVGRHCVFSITDATKVGSLYLGMNDTKDTVTRVQGSLKVQIFEAL